MTLPEFKSIYWMEWAHRMWGRALGLAFVVPGAYFVLVKKTVTPPLARRLALLLAAGGGQGLVGWWMVRWCMLVDGRAHQLRFHALIMTFCTAAIVNKSAVNTTALTKTSSVSSCMVV